MCCYTASVISSLRACLKSSLHGKISPLGTCCGGHGMSQRYPTDLTDTEWSILAPFVPAAKPGGRPRTTDMREVVNAIFYEGRQDAPFRIGEIRGVALRHP